MLGQIVLLGGDLFDNRFEVLAVRLGAGNGDVELRDLFRQLGDVVFNLLELFFRNLLANGDAATADNGSLLGRFEFTPCRKRILAATGLADERIHFVLQLDAGFLCFGAAFGGSSELCCCSVELSEIGRGLFRAGLGESLILRRNARL